LIRNLSPISPSSLCGEGEPKGVRYKAFMLLADVIIHKENVGVELQLHPKTANLPPKANPPKGAVV
jgi:hypothetical protein